ncbi:MAG: hypothetical protein ACKVP4_05240 [Hyphomicrobium sp.]
MVRQLIEISTIHVPKAFMQDESNPNPGVARIADEAKKTGQTEVLEWIGSAYARREDATAAAHALADDVDGPADTGETTEPLAVASTQEEIEKTWSVLGLVRSKLELSDIEVLAQKFPRAQLIAHRRTAVAGLVGLLGALIAVATLDALSTADPDNAMEVQKSPTGNGAREHGKSEIAAAAPAADETARADAERKVRDIEAQLSEALTKREESERTLAEVRGQLDVEQSSRASLEARVAELTSTLTAQTQKIADAERSDAEARAELEAERKARAELENAAQADREPATLALAPARTEDRAAATVLHAPTSTPSPQQAAAAAPTKTKVASTRPLKPKAPDAALSALRKGQERFAKGYLAAAREHFSKAAAMGLPEGALALGNTFDSVSLAKAGLKHSGNPERARQWYRRAFELTRLQR